MPTPPELVNILAELGDGGSVPLARKVEQMLAAAGSQNDKEAREEHLKTRGALSDLLRHVGVDPGGDPLGVAQAFLSAQPPKETEETPVSGGAAEEEEDASDPEEEQATEAEEVVEWDDTTSSEPVKEEVTATAAEIRAWCKENNIECTTRGAIPKAAREAYTLAHQ